MPDEDMPSSYQGELHILCRFEEPAGTSSTGVTGKLLLAAGSFALLGAAHHTLDTAVAHAEPVAEEKTPIVENPATTEGQVHF